MTPKSITIFFFLSRDIQPNSGPVSLNNHIVIYSVDIYKPFLISTLQNYLVTLNSRSACNKLADIFDYTI